MACLSQFESNSLYVGDLDLAVTESHLYQIFSKVGNVISIRVYRHAISGLSLGYAHVKYSNARDAEQALKLFNFTLVYEKPMRIMPASRDSRGRKSGIGNIFIKNFEKSITSRALFDTFSIFGSILSCKVETNASGQSKGYGFVQFEHEEAAQSAIEKVNGMLLKNKQVSVGPFVPRHKRDHPSGEASKFNNVFVKNFAEATTEQALRSHFAVFGEIISAVVMRDSAGESNCFGFVNFKDTDGAARAIEALNGKTIKDHKWFVGRAQKRSERKAELRAKFRGPREHVNQGVNLYLTNPDDTIDDKLLEDLFAEFGVIRSFKVTRNPQGRATGSGLVTFATSEEANSAVANMHRRVVGTKMLCVAPAQRTEEGHAWRLPMPTAAAGIGPAVPTYHTDPAEFRQPVSYQNGQPLPGAPQFRQPISFENGQPLLGYTHPVSLLVLISLTSNRCFVASDLEVSRI